MTWEFILLALACLSFALATFGLGLLLAFLVPTIHAL